MKKQVLTYLIFTFIIAMISLVLQSCKDDENGEPLSPDTFTTEYNFEVQFSEDVLKTSDVKVLVYKPNGEVYTKELTSNQDVLRLTGNAAPDKAGIRFDFVPKDNVAKGDYDIIYKVKATIKVYNGSELYSMTSDEAEQTLDVSSENLADLYHTSMVVAGEVNPKGEPMLTDGSDIDFGVNSDEWDSFWDFVAQLPFEDLDDAQFFEQLFFYRDKDGVLHLRDDYSLLDSNDSGKIYVPCYSFQDAQEIFLNWINKYDDWKIIYFGNGDIKYRPMDKNGNQQGEIYFRRSYNEPVYATVTFSEDVPITLFHEVIFMKEEAFPKNQ